MPPLIYENISRRYDFRMASESTATTVEESNDPILAVRQAMVDLYAALGNPREVEMSQAKLRAWPDEKAKLLAKREAIEQ